MAEAIEEHNGRDVTEAAIRCNLGSGLMEAMRIAPIVAHEGDLIDVVVRMQVMRTGHEPVFKEDFDGPYRRIHYAKPLAVTPTTSAAVGTILDRHIGQVSKARELPGQTSIDDDIEAEVVPLEKVARKRSKKNHPSAAGNGDA